MIVPKLKRCAGFAGETLTIGLSLATGGHSLAGGEVHWEVEGQSGRIPVPAAPALSVADTSGLRLVLPALGPSRMMLLRLSAHVGGKVVAMNQVEIALYRHVDAKGLPSVSAPEALRP